MPEAPTKSARALADLQSHTAPVRRWNPRSIAILVLAWLILQFGGIFSPGLLDDVDSIYIQIGREMLHRHDYVTPYIDGIRFFDKPPLMYWMAAASMSIFGEHDWAARIPLILAVLALLLSVYALGIRLFSSISPPSHPDRGGLYAALAIATSIGPYLFTRFYIPDILLALWMTLAVHLTLIAVDRLNRVPHDHRSEAPVIVGSFTTQPTPETQPSALIPCLAFAAILALNVLTKGLIGLVFPIAFVFLYLALTNQLRLLPRLHLLSSTAVFLAIAAPWHILAALRNPAIALPAGLGLPAKGGWAWFYLYNEHIARFLSKRIPHDYGQFPVWKFWIMFIIWAMPWATFLPGVLQVSILRLGFGSRQSRVPHVSTLRHGLESHPNRKFSDIARSHEAATSLFLWIAIVIGFFTLSARQEYYSLPALPALALLAGAALAWADAQPESAAERTTLRWSLFFLVPLTTLIALICGYFAIFAPHVPPGTDLATLLDSNPDLYNLSLGHIYDLTGDAMGLFRGPLTAVALSMIAVGPIAYLLRRRGLTFAANLTLAAGMTVTLLAAHEGLVRFNPILGSKHLAEAINQAEAHQPSSTTNQQPATNNQQPPLIIIDGELTSGSALLFYTGQQVHLIDGRVNGLWYGSFWPDAPAIFETDASLYQLWSSPRRIFLFTPNPTQRQKELAPYGPVHTLADEGGKTILTNQ